MSHPVPLVNILLAVCWIAVWPLPLLAQSPVNAKTEEFLVRGDLIAVQKGKGAVRLSAPGDWLKGSSSDEIRSYFLNPENSLVLRDRTGTDRGRFVATRVQIETRTHPGDYPRITLFGNIDPADQIMELTLGTIAGQYKDLHSFQPPILYQPRPRKSLRSYTHPVDQKEMLLVTWDFAVYGQGADSSGDNYNPYFFERDPSITPRIPTFYMDKTEVTNSEFFIFCRATGHPLPPSWRQRGSYAKGQGDYPFEEASFDDASAYAKWTGKRIPTEIEWEMAARGGLSLLMDGSGPESLRNSPPIYPTGDTFNPSQCNTLESGRNGPLPVSALNDSGPYGHLGLCGNVREWTSSYYNPYPGHRFRKNQAFLTGTQFHVIRGGSYHQDARMARADFRDFGGFPAPEDDRSAGFRLVMNPE